MNGHNRNPTLFKSFFLILFSLSVFVSCNKNSDEYVGTTTIKSENVCTLKPEQMPEVRGFRLGMTYDELKKRFPNICPLRDKSTEHSIKLYKPSKNNSSDSSKECWEVSIESHPELEGVSEIRFTLWKGILERFLIEYDGTNDEKFDFTFRRTMKEAMGLTQFTNWNAANDVDDINHWTLSGIYNPQGEQLLCDKLNVAVGIGKYVYGNSPTEYSPFIEIRTTNMTAVTKAQAEQEKKVAEDKDKQKRDTFKP